MHVTDVLFGDVVFVEVINFGANRGQQGKKCFFRVYNESAPNILAFERRMRSFLEGFFGNRIFVLYVKWNYLV